MKKWLREQDYKQSSDEQRELTMRLRKVFLWICLLVAFAFLPGCQNELGVKNSSKEDWLASRVANPLIGMGMSYRVKNFLTQELLWDEYNKDPNALLKKLNQKFYETKDQNVLLTLVELSYMEGKKKESLEALYYYLSCSIYTAAYFQTEQLTPAPTPFSPRFLYACRFYNYATAEILTILQQEKYRLGKCYDFATIQGKFKLKPAQSSLPLPFNEYEKFLICSNYVPYGFLTAARTYGMGVPLIAIPDGEYDLKNAKKIGVFT